MKLHCKFDCGVPSNKVHNYPLVSSQQTFEQSHSIDEYLLYLRICSLPMD
jgi:hypothetical protein